MSSRRSKRRRRSSRPPTRAWALAKKAYLPDGDVYLQWNRGTRNNVFGLLLPSASVPSISGPALDETTSESTFGSVAAILVRWEAFDFGVRAAGVREAEALKQRAEMGLRVTKFDVSLGTLDDFLAFVGAGVGRTCRGGDRRAHGGIRRRRRGSRRERIETRSRPVAGTRRAGAGSYRAHPCRAASGGGAHETLRVARPCGRAYRGRWQRAHRFGSYDRQARTGRRATGGNVPPVGRAPSKPSSTRLGRARTRRRSPIFPRSTFSPPFTLGEPVRFSTEHSKEVRPAFGPTRRTGRSVWPSGFRFSRSRNPGNKRPSCISGQERRKRATTTLSNT